MELILLHIETRNTIFHIVGVQYRLEDGNAPSNGRVEISHDNIWGTVCDLGWDKPDALVICKSLGKLRK